MASSPFLSKRLADADGNDAPAEKEETFVFLIYEGDALEGVENLGLADAAQKLQEAGRALQGRTFCSPGQRQYRRIGTEKLKCRTYAEEDGSVSRQINPGNGRISKSIPSWELPQEMAKRRQSTYLEISMITAATI